MCLDLDIPPQVFAPQISTAIRTQIEEYAPVAEIQIPEETELRVIVNIQLHLAKHLLRDQFEWNLSSNELTPEDFATLVCQDLALSSGTLPTSLSNISHRLSPITSPCHPRVPPPSQKGCPRGKSPNVHQ